MGGELGDETYAGVPLVSFALPPPIFHLDREHRYLYEFSVEKLELLSVFANISARSSRGKKKLKIFTYVFLGMCSVASASAIPIFKS